jgi:glycerate dehydrogenase
MRAVFLDYDTVSNGDLDRSVFARAVESVEYFGTTEPTRIAERIGNADIVLLNKVKLARAQFQEAPKLKLIAVAGTGTDQVDLGAARERGIAVCNVRGYCTQSVVQHAWSMILSLTQHLPQFARLTMDGSWVKREESTLFAHSIRELGGCTLGVVGWGDLGRGVAKIADAFGMQVIVANRPRGVAEPGRVDLAQLLQRSDVVSLHCPLTPATRGLLGARELALMKPGALLINTARGALVDSLALAKALKEGRLAGAGIDALAQEPPVDGDPLLDPDIPNLIVTPHIAWAAREARQRCLADMAANIEDFLRGGRRGRVV